MIASSKDQQEFKDIAAITLTRVTNDYAGENEREEAAKALCLRGELTFQSYMSLIFL